jgi:hypothetical protein
MAWYNFWKTPTPAIKAKPIAEPQSPDLSVFDYPKSKYKVYWETHLFEHPEGPWVAEVRFIGYNGFDHRSNHSVTGASKDAVQGLVNKLVKEKMEDYKWH